MKTYTFVTLALVLLSFRSPMEAQWIQTNGPSGGPIDCFAVSGSNLFAGTGHGGVYRSTNNGSSWTAVNSDLNDSTINAFALIGSNLFAGTRSAGVFLSTNNGTNWVSASTGLHEFTTANAFAVSGTNLFLGTFGGGVVLSTNNGTLWTLTGLRDSVVTALAVSGTNLFAGMGAITPGGVFRSTNNGASWSAVNTGLPSATSVSALAVIGTNLFAGTDHGVFLSTNNGASWSPANDGLANLLVLSFAVSGTNLFAGTDGGGVFRSTNNGISWTAVNTGLTNFVVNALILSDTNLFAGTNDGVWRRSLSEMITAVEELLTNSPTHFSLEQNYPNPFNPSTKISFKLPVSGFTSLKVHDVLGREVATLVNEELKPGSYEVTWDADELASGMYFYRLQARPSSSSIGGQAGEFVSVKRLLLLK